MNTLKAAELAVICTDQSIMNILSNWSKVHKKSIILIHE